MIVYVCDVCIFDLSTYSSIHLYLPPIWYTMHPVTYKIPRCYASIGCPCAGFSWDAKGELGSPGDTLDGHHAERGPQMHHSSLRSCMTYGAWPVKKADPLEGELGVLVFHLSVRVFSYGY